jgi:hypothetical protein
MKMKIAIAVTFLTCITGCLSFGVEDQNNIATTGAVYSSQTSALVDEAIQSMNSSDSAALLVTKTPDSLKSDPRFSEQELTKRLSASNEGLISNTVSALELKASLNSVNAYFFGLQALVDDPTAERNVLAVANLANQVNNLNDALQEKGHFDPALSREKKNALLQLTQVVSDQIHARKVKKALIRDAEVIAMALYLQSEVLSFSEMTIFRDLTSMTNRFYVEKVEQPYQKQDSTMNEQWVANRTLYLKTMANIKELEARQNNRDDAMLQIDLWSSALNGKYDATIVSEQIIDIRKMIALKADIEKAAKQ